MRVFYKTRATLSDTNLEELHLCQYFCPRFQQFPEFTLSSHWKLVIYTFFLLVVAITLVLCLRQSNENLSNSFFNTPCDLKKKRRELHGSCDQRIVLAA